ncbi:hypothetical protein [Erwinia billingiae]|uniref:hypothetical protein n=1 Tax=Erwinia billingiae TaxID=182337 RepID=UPI00320970F4
MHQQKAYRISESFCHVLSKVKGQITSRKELITIAMKINKLTEYQASGLVDRHIHSLKKQEAVRATGSKNNRGYIFTASFLMNFLNQSEGDNFSLLNEKKLLEEELLLTGYELQAYVEILEKLPQAKQKISKLHKDASDKLCQLNGKLRAVSQLIAM